MATILAELEAAAARGETGLALLRRALTGSAAGRMPVVSSFGAESAVLLALVAEIAPDAPVVFLQTGRHFPETLAYRDRLVRHLGLTGLRSVGPEPNEEKAADPQRSLWFFDADACCRLRKVVPMDRALTGSAGWITGRKRHQAATRTALPFVEVRDGRAVLNPLADWDAAALQREASRRALPPHPLVAEGYASIGCAPCTRPAEEGDPRSGRWAGSAKTECGIHRPVMTAASG